MKKKLIFALLTLPVIFGAFKVTDRVAFDRAAWIADYEQLKQEVEANYANLAWARSAKNVDFVHLDQNTHTALNAARTRSDARAALARFIAGFNDGHFHFESGPPRPVAALMSLLPEKKQARVDYETSAAEACKSFGFSHKRHALAVEHAGLAEARTTEFAAGVLTLEDSRKFGVIRIPLFQQYDYGASCERAWNVFRASRSGDCDDACHESFYEAAKHEVAAQLAREARSVAHGADGLIIDLTGNGGGTEWADNAAAALTPVELKRAPGAFVRGAHWASSFTEDIRAFEKDRNLPDLAIARAMRDSARTSCDLSLIWNDRSYTPRCSNVVTQTAYTQNHFSELAQDEPYTGRLFIMVDKETASASEQFTAILRDNNAALVVGTRTMGVGCGYTNGGIHIKLRHSGLAIRMPDCARMRADGSNEYEGVRPDIAAEWGESAASKGLALEKAMRSIH
jgi:C-terminal processing protease CtpA/Prc